jgi:hypothetical protein
MIGLQLVITMNDGRMMKFDLVRPCAHCPVSQRPAVRGITEI